jgi:tRNA A37 threonylcarbamoyladenosine dehydratase
MAIQICDDSGRADCAKVELDDVVRSAQKPDKAKTHIKLRVKKKGRHGIQCLFAASGKVSGCSNLRYKHWDDFARNRTARHLVMSGQVASFQRPFFV